MKHSVMNRTLACLLCAVMLFSLCPAVSLTAFADNGADEPDIELVDYDEPTPETEPGEEQPEDESSDGELPIIPPKSDLVDEIPLVEFGEAEDEIIIRDDAAEINAATGTAVWDVNGTEYTDLNAAITAASSAKKIRLKTSGTLTAGTYTIPNGYTLLIPYDAGTYTIVGDTPSLVKTHSTPTAHRTLTMENGAKIIVNGDLCLASKLSAQGQNGDSWNGTPSGPYGAIVMNSGSTITVKSGGSLHAWGYISRGTGGGGSVIAESNSTVWEALQFRCWRGGTAICGNAINLLLGNINSVFSDNKVWPLNQYYIQNIEVPLTLMNGATEKVYTAANASNRTVGSAATFIGTGGLFVLSSGSLTKSYDPSTDRLIMDISGNATLGSLSVKVYTISLNSANFVMPITNNITINVHSGKTTVSSDFAILPGAKVSIADNAEVEISSSKNIYVYDSAEWGAYAAGGLKMVPVGYSVENGTTAIRTEADLIDAELDINGTLTVKGKIYTTNSGANIRSSGKTGRVVLTTAPSATATTYQATQSSSTMTKVSISCTAAKLLNGDNSFTATAGAAANTTYYYCAGHDKWETGNTYYRVTYNNNYNAENQASGSMNPTQFGSGHQIQLRTNSFMCADGFVFDGWNTAADGTGTSYADGATVTLSANTTLYAQWKLSGYTVTWKNADGTVLEIDENVAAATTPTYNGATPTKAGHSFAGWSTDGSTVLSTLPSVSDNTEFIAVFTLNIATVTISYNKDGETAGSEAAKTFSYGDEIQLPALQYYDLASWSFGAHSGTTAAELNAALNSALETTSGQSIEVTASYTRQKYSIQLYASVGGSETAISGMNADRDVGKSVRVSAPGSYGGQSFSYWEILWRESGSTGAFTHESYVANQKGTFFAIKPGEYKAVAFFGATVPSGEDAVSIRIANIYGENLDGTSKICVTLEVTMPENYTITDAGFVYATNPANLSNDPPPKRTISAANLREGVTALNGSYTSKFTTDSTHSTYYIGGYLSYTDENGASHVYYCKQNTQKTESLVYNTISYDGVTLTVQ